MNKGRCINEGQVWFGFILWQLWKAALGHALIWLGATHASLPDLVGSGCPSLCPVSSSSSFSRLVSFFL
jgi:hypothetical protein